MSIPIDTAPNQSALSDLAPEQTEAKQKTVQQEIMSEPDSIANPNGTLAWPPGFCAAISPQATRYAMSIVRRWSDAEEIVQEAFCRVIKSNQNRIQNETPNSEHKDESLAKAILFTTIRNLSIDQLRKQGRQTFEPVDAQTIPDFRSQSNDSNIEHLETGIERSIERLPTHWADALKLKVNGELSYDEIANVMEVTHAQVRTWIYRARKQLQIELQQLGFLDAQSPSDHNKRSKKTGGNDE